MGHITQPGNLQVGHVWARLQWGICT